MLQKIIVWSIILEFFEIIIVIEIIIKAFSGYKFKQEKIAS